MVARWVDLRVDQSQFSHRVWLVRLVQSLLPNHPYSVQSDKRALLDLLDDIVAIPTSSALKHLRVLLANASDRCQLNLHIEDFEQESDAFLPGPESSSLGSSVVG